MPSDRVLKGMVYTWGNAGWSADVEYIKTILKFAQASTGPIVECGSGLSTLLLGVIAVKYDKNVVSFEHDPAWAHRVQTELHRYGLSNSTVELKPLKNYGEFYWYDLTNCSIDRVDLCICDAPPGKTYGGRKGFLYLFKEKLSRGAVILVDDVIREGEREMIAEWCGVMPFEVTFVGVDDPHAVLRVTER